MAKAGLSIFLIIVIFASCSSSPRYGRSAPAKYKKAISSTSKKSEPKSKAIFIDPKTVNTNVKHKKRMVGISSFYAEDFHGKLTANGEIYDMYGLTAAHKTLPLNTVARVTNLENGKSLILRINDRGPYIQGRMLDCSYGAAKKLDFVQQGKTKVQVDVIEWGDGKYMHHRKSPK
jgi:rare lipoprotein A